MRITLFQLLLTGALAISASAGTLKGQGVLDRKISLSETGQNLKKVLHNIEKVADVKFTYDSRLVASKGEVNLDAKDEDLKIVLDKLLNPLSIQYEVVNDQIILKKIVRVGGADVVASEYVQPGNTVNGTVTTKDGAPIAGASVTVLGSHKGVMTDASGHFEIQAKEGDVIVISVVGYTTVKEAVGKQNTLSFKMEEGKSEMGEVVVTALGIKRSTRALGYSEEQIKGSEIQESNAPNVVNALSGKMAGVAVTQPNGVDGGSTRIIIGGNNTISQDNQPLIIIDGMPMDNTIPNAAQDVTAPKDWGSAINLINPADIEDFSVLKGPAAAALYGGRGANGVILITTKKGSKRNGLGVDYNFQGKINDPYRFLKMQNEYGAGGMVSLDPPQYQTNAAGQDILTDGWTNMFVDQKTGTGPYGIATWNQVSWPGTGVSWGHKMDGTPLIWWDGVTRPDDPQPNNIKSYYRDGYQLTHNVSVQGGNEFGSLRASYTRLDNESIIPNSDFNQNTFNLGGQMKLTKRVSIQVTASYYNNTYHNAPQLGNNESGSIQSNLIYAYSRDYRGKADNGNYLNYDGSQNKFTDPAAGTAFPWTGNGQAQYIYWNTYMNNEYVTRDKILGAAQLNYEATSFLNFMFRASIDANTNQDETINSPTDPTGTIGGTYANGLTKDNANNYDWLGTLHKDNIFHSDINAKWSVGGEAYSRNMYNIAGTTNGYNMASAGLTYFGNYVGSPQPSQIPSEAWIKEKMNSIYSFINLSYKNWLYVDITGRNDWSSTLAPTAWSYFFPSFSASWVFTDALHLNSSWLTFGKLRAAWAEAAVTVPYTTINNTYQVGSFAGQPTTQLPTSLNSQNYQPQTNKTADFGITLGILKDRINFDFRYYNGKSYHQVAAVPAGMSSGVTSITANTGVLQNSGLEAQLRVKLVEKRNFKWDISINGYNNYNKLLSLNPLVNQLNMNNIWGASGVYISALVGHEYGEIMSYDYVRDPSTHKPLLQTASEIQTNFGVDAGTAASMVGTVYKATTSMVPIGNSTPKFRGGMTNTFTFKGGFSVSFLVDAKIGGQIWAGSWASMMQQGLAPETLKERNGGGLPYTTPNGTSTNYGVILPGVYDDGKSTPNTTVVHYYYKYMTYGVWSSGPNNSQWIHSTAVLNDTWYKLREFDINYAIPDRIVKKTKAFQAISVSLVGRDLFYIHSSLPDNVNPEGVNGAGNAQGIEFASLPGVRSVGVMVHLGF
jgi:iron complex outermembrane receptor protein